MATEGSMNFSLSNFGWHSVANPVPPSMTGFTFGTPQHQFSLPQPPPSPNRLALLGQAALGSLSGLAYTGSDAVNLTRRSFSGPSIAPSLNSSPSKQPLPPPGNYPFSTDTDILSGLERGLIDVGNWASTFSDITAKENPILKQKFYEAQEKIPPLAISAASLVPQLRLLNSAKIGGALQFAATAIGQTATITSTLNTLDTARQGSAFFDVAENKPNERSYEIANKALSDYTKPTLTSEKISSSMADAVMSPTANINIAVADVFAKEHKQRGLEKLAGVNEVTWGDRLNLFSPLMAEVTADALSSVAFKRFLPTSSWVNPAARAGGQAMQMEIDSAQRFSQAELVSAAQKKLELYRAKQ